MRRAEPAFLQAFEVCERTGIPSTESLGCWRWTNQQGSRAVGQDCNVPSPINPSGNRPIGGRGLLESGRGGGLRSPADNNINLKPPLQND